MKIEFDWESDQYFAARETFNVRHQNVERHAEMVIQHRFATGQSPEQPERVEDASVDREEAGGRSECANTAEQSVPDGKNPDCFATTEQVRF